MLIYDSDKGIFYLVLSWLVYQVRFDESETDLILSSSPWSLSHWPKFSLNYKDFLTPD